MGLFDDKKYFEDISGDELHSILKDQGYAPELTKDRGGDPMVSMRIEGLKCAVLFYSVKDERSPSLQFTAVFGDRVPVEAVNQWNAQKRFGKAYLDPEGDLHLNLDIDLYGGVRQKYIEEIVGRWRGVITGFVRFMSEQIAK